MCRACPEKEAWKLVSFVSSHTYSSVPMVHFLSAPGTELDFHFAVFYILTQDWRWPHSCKMLSKRSAAVHDGAAYVYTLERNLYMIQ